ncbi:recombinase family protein [Massilia atriviolacea]|uniref:Resolvase n=1 Tax=Massilia atriviolacea TaxID=2495579 RepID=A0A430HDM1_9BURK|nr:recombinase family protein [Massilia atriviolacea]RSZ55599.1 resolvase [Massilia atriviolacea]
MSKPIARIYQRVSTEGQELTRQQSLRAEAEAKGYTVVATYSEKASGTSEDRPELQRMLADLNDGDTIIAEHLDRITRLPLPEAEALMKRIKATGAAVSVPGLIELPKVGDGVAAIVVDAMQEMLLRIALYQCRADWETRRERQKQGIAIAKAKGVYKGRKPDTVANAKIVELRALGYTIAKVASTLNVSESQVKLILKKSTTVTQ